MVKKSQIVQNSIEGYASQFLADLDGIIQNHTLSDKEKYDEVCSLVKGDKKYTEDFVDEYLDNATFEEAEEPEIQNDDAILLAEIKEKYFAENNLTDDSFSELGLSTQVKHRRNISLLYSEEMKKHERTSTLDKLKKGPFGRITVDKEDNNDDTALNWHLDQIAELEYQIGIFNDELQQLEIQNSKLKESSSISPLNQRKIHDLLLEKKPLELKLKNYKLKLQGDNDASN